MEWSEGGEWDNCNSIINKYIKKIKMSVYSGSKVQNNWHKPSKMRLDSGLVFILRSLNVAWKHI